MEILMVSLAFHTIFVLTGRGEANANVRSLVEKSCRNVAQLQILQVKGNYNVFKHVNENNIIILHKYNSLKTQSVLLK